MVPVGILYYLKLIPSRERIPRMSPQPHQECGELYVTIIAHLQSDNNTPTIKLPYKHIQTEFIDRIMKEVNL